MKLLSIAIPSYNAAAYLHYCVESLVIGGEQVEILIINDGSQDQTQEIAERFSTFFSVADVANSHIVTVSVKTSKDT